MADTNMTTTAIVYQGIAINRRDEMLSLTDMWKAAGSPERQRPADWKNDASNVAFLNHVAMISNTAPDGIWNGQRGNGGSTFAHWQVGLAYAKYLSPEFHVWCNTVVRERMEGRPVPTMNREQIMASALLLADETMKEQAGQIAILAPKAEALDRIATVSDGALSLTEAAKALQMRPKDLVGFLSANGWIYRRAGGSGLLGYANRTNAGDLEHKITTVLRADGSEKMVEQVKVTPRGLAKLAKLITGRLSIAA